MQKIGRVQYFCVTQNRFYKLRKTKIIFRFMMFNLKQKKGKADKK